MAKVVALTVRNKAGAIALAAGVVVLGVVFLTVGFALLAAFAVGGAVVGTAYGAYARLRGHDRLPSSRANVRVGLDPSLEVRPVEPPKVRQLPTDSRSSDDAR